MTWLREICRFEFKSADGVSSFQVGWLWVAIIVFGLWYLFA